MDIVQAVSLAVATTSCLAAIGATIVAYTTYRRQTSPEVIVYTDRSPNGSSVEYLYIENIGNAPAYNVSVTLDGDIPTKLHSRAAFDVGPIGGGVPFLQPGGKRGVPLAVSFEFVEGMGEKVVLAEVVCFRSGGDRPRGKQTATFPIEAMSLHGCATDEPKDVIELRRIAVAAEKALKEYAGRTQ